MPEVRAGSESGLGTRIEISGFAESLLALSHVDEEMAKQFRKRLKATGTIIAETARRSAPRGRSGLMQMSYKSQLRSRESVTVVKVLNETRQGQILEFAGSTTNGSGIRRTKNGVVPSNQGRNLIASLNSKYGETGRFMWAAYDALEPYIVDEVNDAVREVEEFLDSSFRGGEA